MEAAIRKKETDLKCISEERKRSKEKDRRLDSLKDQEKIKDEESQGMGHEALDRSWAWLVLLGAFIIAAVNGVLVPGFGILFSDFLTGLNTSSTVASAIFNAGAFTFSCSNLVAGPLTEQFGWRSVAVGGGLLAFVGMGASAFTSSASFLFFSYSILTGLGTGHSVLVAYVVIPHYFKRRIGRANAVMSSGVCIGGMVGPPAVTFLQEQYGFRGATLLVAAFTLNVCLAGALFRPVQRPSDVTKATEGTDKEAKDKETKAKENKYKAAKDREAKESKNKTAVTDKDKAAATYKDMTTATDKDRTAATNKDKTAATDTDTRHGLSKDRTSPMDTYTRHGGSKYKTTPTDTPGPCHVARQMASSLITYWKFLKSSHVVLLVFGGAFMMVGYINLSALVPFVIQEYGHTQGAAAWCLSVANLCNLATRLLMASCSDFSWFNTRGCFIVFAVMMSLSTVVVGLVQDLTWVTVALAVWGCGVGTCVALHPLLLLQYVGVRQFVAALVLHGLLTGLWTIISGVLIGILRDLSGNYTVSLCFIGASVFITVILYLLVPIAVAYDKRKQDQQRVKDAELGG